MRLRRDGRSIREGCKEPNTDLEILIVDVLKDQRWRFRLWIPNYVEQRDDIRTANQVLQDFDLPLDLLLLHRLQNLRGAQNRFLLLEGCSAISTCTEGNGRHRTFTTHFWSLTT